MKILAIPGSLRKKSLNRRLLQAAGEFVPQGVELELHELHGIPLYDADDEVEGDPDPVKLFKAAIRTADSLLIATPEYNHGIPGVLKNALDWASRPAGHSVLAGKPVGILGASPSIVGTARGQAQLKQVLHGMQMPLFSSGEFLCGRAHERFDRDGRLTDDKTREHLDRYVNAFVAWVAAGSESC